MLDAFHVAGDLNASQVGAFWQKRENRKSQDISKWSDKKLARRERRNDRKLARVNRKIAKGKTHGGLFGRKDLRAQQARLQDKDRALDRATATRSSGMTDARYGFVSETPLALARSAFAAALPALRNRLGMTPDGGLGLFPGTHSPALSFDQGPRNSRLQDLTAILKGAAESVTPRKAWIFYLPADYTVVFVELGSPDYDVLRAAGGQVLGLANEGRADAAAGFVHIGHISQWGL